MKIPLEQAIALLQREDVLIKIGDHHPDAETEVRDFAEITPPDDWFINSYPEDDDENGYSAYWCYASDNEEVEINGNVMLLKARDGAVVEIRLLLPMNLEQACDCGGSPHGAHCAAVEAGIATTEWRCGECGQHAGNCPHPQPVTLRQAYEATLGGVFAISPEFYASALEHMARLTGRENDAAFREEVAEVGRSMPCDLD